SINPRSTSFSRSAYALSALPGSCCCTSCLSCSFSRRYSERVMIWLLTRAMISSTTESALKAAGTAARQTARNREKRWCIGLQWSIATKNSRVPGILSGDCTSAALSAATASPVIIVRFRALREVRRYPFSYEAHFYSADPRDSSRGCCSTYGGSEPGATSQDG